MKKPKPERDSVIEMIKQEGSPDQIKLLTSFCLIAIGQLIEHYHMMLSANFPQLQSKQLKDLKKKTKEELKAAKIARDLVIAQALSLIQQTI
jgi:hypothetical protein